jgi:hypothetical protein
MRIGVRSAGLGLAVGGLLLGAVPQSGAAESVPAPLASHVFSSPRAASASADQPRQLTGQASSNGCAFRQLSDPNGVAVVSQNLEAALDQYDVAAADDFTCARSVQKLRRITIEGAFFNGTGSSQMPLDIAILRNDRTGEDDEPSDGPAVCSYHLTVDGSSDGTFVVDVRDTRCRLHAGRTYWLQAQLSLDFTQGQWGWLATDRSKRLPADWVNPGDGYGTGCTSYSAPGAGGDRYLAGCLTDPYPPSTGLLFAVR